MKVLGIDTSGYANAIGVVDQNRILADLVFAARADSLEKIVAHIEATLKQANLSLKDVEGFGVGLGPGSWTGIRVGVTVGKMLAFSTGKPVCGIPTLAVLAYQAKDTLSQICPIIYAGTRDTVYAAFYQPKNDTVIRVSEYYVGEINGLAKMIKTPTVLVGSGVPSYLKLIIPALSTDITIEAREDIPRGASIALLATSRLARGERDDVLSLTPLYLKESTAQAFVSKYSVVSPAKG